MKTIQLFFTAFRYCYTVLYHKIRVSNFCAMHWETRHHRVPNRPQQKVSYNIHTTQLSWTQRPDIRNRRGTLSCPWGVMLHCPTTRWMQEYTRETNTISASSSLPRSHSRQNHCTPPPPSGFKLKVTSCEQPIPGYITVQLCILILQTKFKSVKNKKNIIQQPTF